MTTSEERRKAAELMRNEAADFRRLGEEYGDAWTVDLGDVPAIFQDITHYVGLDGVVRADAIFDRIADFIDPSDYDQPHEYCPNCGARVVDDDGQD